MFIYILSLPSEGLLDLRMDFLLMFSKLEGKHAESGKS